MGWEGALMNVGLDRGALQAEAGVTQGCWLPIAHTAECVGLSGLATPLQGKDLRDHRPKCKYLPAWDPAAVVAAARDAAGAEAGDGRDESNKSLQERLADAQVAQNAADADAKAADVAAKHAAKQLAEQRAALKRTEKESGGAQKELAQHQAAVEEGQRRLQVGGGDGGRGRGCVSVLREC